MRLIILLSSFILVNSQDDVIEKNECDSILVNNVYHDKEILKSEIDRPFMLATDYNANTLYFSYNINVDEFQSARLNLDSKEFANIDVKNGFTQTVDQKTQDVYIGTREGIHKYDPSTGTAIFVGAGEFDVWSVYFKDVLYFITFPNEILYTFDNGEIVKLVETQDFKVNAFIKAKDDANVFANVTGIYRMNKFKNETVPLLEDNGGGVVGITNDNDGVTYAATTNGKIYKLEENIMKEIADVQKLYGIAFDKDNKMIIATADSLIRLEPNNDNSCDK